MLHACFAWSEAHADLPTAATPVGRIELAVARTYECLGRRRPVLIDNQAQSQTNRSPWIRAVWLGDEAVRGRERSAAVGCGTDGKI